MTRPAENQARGEAPTVAKLQQTVEAALDNLLAIVEAAERERHYWREKACGAFSEAESANVAALAAEEREKQLREALEEIEDGTTADRIGRYNLLRDWVNKTARAALARDGGGA